MTDEKRAIANSRLGLMLYSTLGLCAVAVLFLTNWPSYQFEIRGGPIPLYFYFLPGILIVPMLCAEPAASVRFARDSLLWWFVLYAATGLLWLMAAQDFIEVGARQWRLRLLAFFFFYTLTIMAVEAKRPWVAFAIAACVAIACAANWFDVLRPYHFVPKGAEEGAAGRGAGFFINPNAAAAFVVMGTIAVLPFAHRAIRPLLLLAAVVGVAPTFSRSGFVLAVVTAAGAAWLRLLSRAQAAIVIVAIPVLAGSIAMSYDFLIQQSEDRNFQNIVRRLAWFEDRTEDEAIEGRMYGAREAWQVFLDAPVTGGGVGVVSREILQAGPHNMYLALMAEQGIFGLILYMALIALITRRGWHVMRTAATADAQDIGRATALFGLFIGAYGFFSHNVLEEPYTLFVLAFLIAASSSVATISHRIAAPPVLRAQSVSRAASS